MKHRAIFITATDTGVGKSIVTALLLSYLRQRGHHAVAMKPISSGDRNDARLLRSVVDNEVSLDEINPIYFKNPVAPFIAERLEKRAWKMSSIRSSLRALRFRFSPVLVEGIGGLLVPLRRRYFARDLVRGLNLPLLIVARPGLGTLNHTALTIEVARAAGLTILGVVLNDSAGRPHGIAERTNAKAIEETCGVKVVATIPYLNGLKPDDAGIRAALRRTTVRAAVAGVAALL